MIKSKPAPGLSEATTAALKSLRIGEHVMLSGRMGEIAGSGVFDLSRPVRQERRETSTVHTEAALRGPHRGHRSGRRKLERTPSAVVHVRFSLRHQETPGLRFERRCLLPTSRRDRWSAHDGQGRQRRGRGDYQRHHHHRSGAHHERYWGRRLLHPVGRKEAGGPQCLGPFAWADDARPV